MNMFDGDPRIAIPQVITAFTCHQDNQEWEAALKVCTEDFVIEKNGVTHDVTYLRTSWKNRFEIPGIVFRHIRTGLHFSELTDNTASTVGFGLFFRCKGHIDGTVPFLGHPVHLTQYHEKFVKTDSGWKIKHRLCIDIMQHEQPS
jgi:hypothetical protein